jgi:hypothetical protein
MAATTLDHAYLEARSEGIPWYLWAGLIATTSAVVGGQWDISWHRSIGRDTFWTPAHMAIYLCGLIAGFGGGAVTLLSTFGSHDENKQSTVRLWGFRAPLGIFMCIWGAVAMLASAPFDDWWHSAYGLDVKILSPPHVVLALGMQTIQFGVLIMTLGEMNRATGRRKKILEWMYLYGAAMMFSALLTVLMETNFRANMHTAGFYQVMTTAALIVMAGIARACGNRWSATIVAALYSVLMMGLVWILPQFHAEPKLGPVYQQITYFTPPDFPLLLIVPAILLDLLLKRFEKWNKWALAAVSSVAFLVLFIAVQWPFADFLMSPASRNWFFGTMYVPYYLPPDSFIAMNLFFPPDPPAMFWSGLAAAAGTCFIATRASLAWGDWMRRIQR